MLRVRRAAVVVTCPTQERCWLRSTQGTFLVLLFLTIHLCTFVAAECVGKVAKCDAGTDYFPEKSRIEYAKQTITSLRYQNTYVDVDIQSPDFGQSGQYRLVKCGCENVAPNPSGGRQKISIPPEKVYVGDTVIMALLTAEIAAADRVRAVSDISIVYSSAIRRRVQSGEIKSVKDPKELAALEDEIDIAFIGSSDIDTYKNASLSIPSFLVAEVAEPSPLGRAEWIKLFGVIFDQVAPTSSRFDIIRTGYQTVRDKAFSVQRRPSALVNMPFTDSGVTTWSLPSGAQYTAQFLQDANVDYRFAGSTQPGSLTLTVDQVAGNFSSARYWINMGRFPAVKDDTVDALVTGKEFSADTKDTFKKLAAVKCGNTWAQTKRITDDGNANDFFESGALRPDLILSDMLKIFHPGVKTGALGDADDLYYYYSLGKPSSDEIAECPYNTLPDKPAKGKKFVTSEFEVNGADRFEVEDKIPSSIAPAVAKAANVTEKDVELYFTRAQKENSTDSFLNVKAMVPNDDADSFDEDKVASAIQRSLGDDVKVKPVSSEVSDSGSDSDDGLSGGAIAGIVLASLALLALVALLSCLCALRRGKQKGYKEVKDRFWQEHGVRLAEDTHSRAEGSLSSDPARPDSQA